MSIIPTKQIAELPVAQSLDGFSMLGSIAGKTYQAPFSLINPLFGVSQTIAKGDTTHAPSSDAVAAALDSKEPTITKGVTGQYFDGSKTWIDLPNQLAIGTTSTTAYAGDKGLQNSKDIITNANALTALSKLCVLASPKNAGFISIDQLNLIQDIMTNQEAILQAMQEQTAATQQLAEITSKSWGCRILITTSVDTPQYLEAAAFRMTTGTFAYVKNSFGIRKYDESLYADVTPFAFQGGYEQIDILADNMTLLSTACRGNLSVDIITDTPLSYTSYTNLDFLDLSKVAIIKALNIRHLLMTSLYVTNKMDVDSTIIFTDAPNFIGIVVNAGFTCKTFRMTTCPALTLATVQSYINKIADRSATTVGTFTLDASMFAQLTTADTNMLTAKNFNIISI